jgi:predicted metalloprotease
MGGAEMLSRGAGSLTQSSSSGTRGPVKDELGQFASKVLEANELVWKQLLPQQAGQLVRGADGMRFQEPGLVLYAGGTRSGCGSAQAAMGPFYCPQDRKVYLDTSFFQEMATKMRAGGDFAYAYVIAHEVGHHVQNLLGLSAKVQGMQNRAGKKESNELSVRLELQADYLAGVWAHHAQSQKKILQEGDIEEALNAASKIGDDTLQKRAQGRVMPDLFTHGTSKQRVTWFSRGFKSGDVQGMMQPFELPYDQL